MKIKYRSYDVLPSATVPIGVVYRPEVTLRIVGPHSALRITALLDTGADETILPLAVAKRLGIKLSAEQTSNAIGVTGHPLPLYPGEVEFEVASGKERFRWKTVVSFADFADADADSECAILGHFGALQFFTATFDGLAHEVTLQSNDSMRLSSQAP